MIKKVFHKIIAGTAVAAMGLSLLVTAIPANAATPAKLSKSKLNLTKGSKKTIKVKGKKIKKVTWKSTKAKVASVKKKKATSAVVTARKKGKAVIKATVQMSGAKKVLKCKVTVNAKNANPVINSSQPDVTASVQPNITATDTPVPNDSEPTPTQTASGPTPVPQLDMNNLAVAEYPTVFSDIPDCDIIRVGGYYYMVSTTMNMVPGAPIMRSSDLVHWQIVSYVHDILADDDANSLKNGKQIYGNGSWAAAIRYYEGTFYVCFNQNGYGFYVYTTDNIESGEWKKHYIDKTSFHDPSLIFDDGALYVTYGGGPLYIQEIVLNDDNETVEKVGSSQVLIQKSDAWGLWEGNHIYKIGDYYYVMIIASPNGAWFRSEVCYRTEDLFSGDWEEQIIFQGSTYEYGTGIAQGGIVDTIYDDWYGILFQDHDAIGRIPSILAVKWDVEGYEDWPMMGTYDDNGNFTTYTSTNAKVQSPLTIRLNDSGEENYIVGDDDFTYAEGDKLKLVWQWNHNPDKDAYSFTDNPGYYRIYNNSTCNNVWFARNSLTQRTVGPKFTSETAIVTDGMKPGDYAGMVALGSDYGMVGVRCDADGNRYIFQGSGSANGARPTNTTLITENESADQIEGTTPVYLKIEYSFNTGSARSDKANFYYSLDGSTWTKIGKELSMSFNTSTTFMGARTWLSSYATSETGGYVDFDYYKAYNN